MQNLASYKEIYDDYMLERLGNGGASIIGITSETKYVNILVKRLVKDKSIDPFFQVKDAIYVLDPKFVNVMGTYLRGYSETQTKTTKLGNKKNADRVGFINIAADYLRPNWNENIHFKVTRGIVKPSISWY